MTSSAAVPGNRLPRRSRDRRAALSALALLLVVLGALGSALVVYRSGHRTDVLAAAHEIRPGQRVTASDFQVTRVAADSAALVPASAQGSFVGSFATTDIPAGSLLNPRMFQVGNVIPTDGVVVGVTLNQSQRPSGELHAGDVVRVFLVPKSSSGDSGATGVLVAAARVTAVSSSSGDLGSSGTAVSLLVRESDAQSVIAAASAGQVALGQLPKSTTPSIDFRKDS